MDRRNALQTLTVAHADPPTGGVSARRILILRTRLAGVRFHAEPEAFDRLRPGDALALTREPDNPHDHDAVRAEWRGNPIGYLPADHNSAPARLLTRASDSKPG